MKEKSSCDLTNGLTSRSIFVRLQFSISLYVPFIQMSFNEEAKYYSGKIEIMKPTIKVMYITTLILFSQLVTL